MAVVCLPLTGCLPVRGTLGLGGHPRLMAWAWLGWRGGGGGTLPPSPLCPATVSLTASASFNGIRNQQ